MKTDSGVAAEAAGYEAGDDGSMLVLTWFQTIQRLGRAWMKTSVNTSVAFATSISFERQAPMNQNFLLLKPLL